MAQNNEQDHHHPGLAAPVARPTSKVRTTCHCGRISVEMPSPPTKINECQCSICYRYGAQWSYFHPDDVRILVRDAQASEERQPSQGTSEGRGGLRSYVRDDVGAGLGFFFCGDCGCLTHWGLTEKGVTMREPRIGVNCRMLPPRFLEGVVREKGKAGDF